MFHVHLSLLKTYTRDIINLLYKRYLSGTPSSRYWIMHLHKMQILEVFHISMSEESINISYREQDTSCWGKVTLGSQNTRLLFPCSMCLVLPGMCGLPFLLQTRKMALFLMPLLLQTSHISVYSHPPLALPPNNILLSPADSLLATIS